MQRFVSKCSLGNPSISLKNVVFITRKSFLEHKKMMKYQDLEEHEHVPAQPLTKRSKVLFISHRWQLDELPDDNEKQYEMIEKFLLNTEVGRSITHLWLDYSCISQDKTSKDFVLQLDNIQTAIVCSTFVLVVPKIEDGFSNLNDYMKRGWCLFEAVSSLFAGCEVWISLHDGQELHFRCVHQPNWLKKICLKQLGFKQVIGQLCDAGVQEEVKGNWVSAKNPEDIHCRVVSTLSERKTEIREMATMTVRLDYPPVGQNISELLPDFSYESDRFKVVNLFANVGGYFTVGYGGLSLRSLDKLQTDITARGCLEGSEINVSGSQLLPGELKEVLGIIPPLHTLTSIDFSDNPLGYNGASVFAEFASSLDCSGQAPCLSMNWDWCFIGDPGARALSECRFIQIQSLSLKSNNIGAESAKAIAASSTLVNLTSLNLGNKIGDEGAKAIAASSTLVNLTSLNLGNKIGDEGAKAIAASSTLVNLTSLNLGYNNIGEAGKEALRNRFAFAEL